MYSFFKEKKKKRGKRKEDKDRRKEKRIRNGERRIKELKCKKIFWLWDHESEKVIQKLKKLMEIKDQGLTLELFQTLLKLMITR